MDVERIALEDILTWPEWQQIDTAPMDGTKIMVCRIEEGYRTPYVLSPVTARYQTGRWEFYFDNAPIPDGFLPTHWMPAIPAPQ